MNSEEKGEQSKTRLSWYYYLFIIVAVITFPIWIVTEIISYVIFGCYIIAVFLIYFCCYECICIKQLDEQTRYNLFNEANCLIFWPCSINNYVYEKCLK